jgi:hypothetical protein
LTWRAGQKPDAPDLRRLLRDRRERPRYRRTANDTDEFPSPHCFTRAEDYVADVKYHISHLGTVPRAKLRRTPGDVRFGSKADIAAPPTNVRFTPVTPRVLGSPQGHEFGDIVAVDGEINGSPGVSGDAQAKVASWVRIAANARWRKPNP